MEHDEAEFGRENEFLFYSYIQMSSDRMFADEIILFHCGQCKKKRFLWAQFDGRWKKEM